MASDTEKDMIEAGERLGRLMAEADDHHKKVLALAHEQLDGFLKEKQAEGKNLDAAALFAIVIISHPEISDESLIQAAKDYVDKDYLFCQTLREARA